MPLTGFFAVLFSPPLLAPLAFAAVLLGVRRTLRVVACRGVIGVADGEVQDRFAANLLAVLQTRSPADGHGVATLSGEHQLLCWWVFAGTWKEPPLRESKTC